MKKLIALTTLALALSACIQDNNSALKQPTGHQQGNQVCGDVNTSACVQLSSCKPPYNPNPVLGTSGFWDCGACTMYENAANTFYSSCL